MTEGLKPCPFCGGEAILCENIDHAYVYCKKCGCQTDESHAIARYAAEAWNTRYKQTCKNIAQWKDGDFKCSICGAELEYAPTKPFGKHETDETVRVNFCPCCEAEVVDD